MTVCTQDSSGRWSADFRRLAAERRIPVSGVLELTGRCNLRCVHCYLGSQDEQRTKMAAEMPTERVLEVIDEICDAGCLYLVITGGDPMIRRDFPEIYRYARERGLIVTVFCDGILVTDAIVELFSEYPPYKVDISVYGSTAQTYEAVTRVQGSFSRFLEGVRRLAAAGIPFSLKTVLMTINRHEVEAMRHMADELGADGFRVDSAIFPCLPDGDRGPLELRLDPEEAVAVELSDPRAMVQWIDYTERQRGGGPEDRLYVCGAGVTNFYIDPYGNASPCLMTTNHCYPMTAERSFRQLWSQELRQIGRIPAGDFVCNGCEMRPACMGCPAFNLQETGSEFQVSSYVCETTRHRWEAIEAARKKRADGEVLPTRT